jgi:hypothetical protein
MPISLRSQKKIITPRLDQIKDPAIAQVLNDFAKVITNMAQNSHDDLTALNAVVDTKANA